MNKTATIAIVGKPNVGKSTIFNRLIGKKHAIITDIAGTTRDRISQKYRLKDYDLLLVDTGGLEFEKKDNIEEDIQAQAGVAIRDADIILFVLDISEDLNPDDYNAADILRKSSKEVILVGNKSDNPNLERNAVETIKLGFGEAVTISAIHNKGIDKLELSLLDSIKNLKFKKSKEIEELRTPSICILGKPNAGKSSLVNSLFGKEKVIVSDIPGTTRDMVDSEITYEDEKIILIDTAGLRRRGKIEKGIEKYSALRCLRAIERSDIVTLLIDGEKGLTSQDLHIVEYALDAKKGLIIGINKEDLLSDLEKEFLLRKIRRKFVFIPWAPVVFLSALKRKNIFKVLDLAKEILKERKKRIKTAELNTFLQKITFKHSPSSKKAKRPKFMYGSQVDINPPKFLLHFKNAVGIHFSYPRYLENQIRKEYGFNGTAIVTRFKGPESRISLD